MVEKVRGWKLSPHRMRLDKGIVISVFVPTLHHTQLLLLVTQTTLPFETGDTDIHVSSPSAELAQSLVPFHSSSLK